MTTVLNERTGTQCVSGRALRNALGTFPTGVTVVSTLDKHGGRVGVTANSFSSVSLDPPLILWCLRDASATFPVFRDNPRFSVSILADDQQAVSKHFATPVGDKFSVHPFEDGIGGIPLISGAAGWLECIKESQYQGGDHTIFVGKVVRCSISDKLPLMFCSGSYLHSSAAFNSARSLAQLERSCP